jgi:hypothetical protein
MDAKEEVRADAKQTPTPKAEVPPEVVENPAAGGVAVMPIEMAAEICELCGLAGYPKLAASFIRSSKPLADVREELLRARADQDAAIEILSQVPLGSNADPGRGAPPVNTKDSPVVQAAEKLAAQAAKGGK